MAKGKGEKMVKLKTLKEHICCFNDVRSEIDIRCTTCGKKNMIYSLKLKEHIASLREKIDNVKRLL